QTIGALLLAGTATITLTINAGVTLTLGSGALMTAQSGGGANLGTTFSANVAQGAINFGADGVIFFNGPGGNNIVSTTPPGTGHLALAGSPAISGGLVMNTGGSANALSPANYILNSGLVNAVTSGTVMGVNFGTATITFVGGVLNTGGTAVNLIFP